MNNRDDPVDDDAAAFLDFFRKAAALKDTLRRGLTAAGRPESVAEHSWRLALMALTIEDELPGIDCDRLIRLLLVHDLAEAITGDTPAPAQTGDKRDAERAAMANLLATLPVGAASRLAALWEDYAAAASTEARLAKGLDRLETLLHHLEGANPPDFDYAFNLDYGRVFTEAHPLLERLRGPIDAETARRAGVERPRD
jgi:putative hydrolase of HD superfamily